MPRHQRPDVSDRLRRYFDVVGSATFDTVAPEVVPIVQIATLEELEAGVAYLGYGAGSFDITPAAGEFGAAVLFNPVDSGLVLDNVRLRVWHTDASRQVIRVVRHSAALATVNSSRFYHPSRSLLISTVGQVTQDDLVAASLTAVVQLLAVPSDRTKNPQIRGLELYPGSGIGFMATTANVRIAGDFNWRERTQRDWEVVP